MFPSIHIWTSVGAEVGVSHLLSQPNRRKPNAVHCHGLEQSQDFIRLFYQLAFFTPGKFPARACNRKLYCQPLVSHNLVPKERPFLTLDILKSLKIPRPFPPRIHRLRIWVGRV
jgi:hypothetical protein